MAEERPSSRRRRGKRSPVGAPPGTLVADPAARPTSLSLTAISPEGSKVFSAVGAAQLLSLREEWPVVWLDCVGLKDVALIGEIGAIFGLHRLALEDVVNTGQRPKTDLYDDYAFVVLDMINEGPGGRYEQVSMFLASDFVITFQERPGDSFEPVRKRIAAGGARLLTRRGDYIGYALIDALVDGYFPPLDKASDRIDRIEDQLLQRPRPGDGRRLNEMRREMIAFKRILWPVRDALATLIRADAAFVAAETRTYLNDTLDHTIRLIETIETNREVLTGLIEMNIALTQARTNEVVKLLTIVSTIFIPLTFLVGVWGMNFDSATSPWNMPELHWYYGYPFALGVMAVIAAALLLYFRWKKWL